MYRQLLNKRNESVKRDGAPLKANQPNNPNRLNSEKKFRRGNDELRSHFTELQSLVHENDSARQNDHRHGNNINSTNLDQKHLRGKQRTEGGSSAMALTSAQTGMPHDTDGYTAERSNYIAATHTPEKQLGGSFRLGEEAEASRGGAFSGSASALGNYDKRHEKQQSADLRNMGKTHMSLNKLSKIEKTSQKQLSSISKLQSKLQKTNQMAGIHSSSRYHSNKRFTANDYVAESDAKVQNIIDSSPGLRSRLPKRVKIAESHQQSLQVMHATTHTAFQTNPQGGSRFGNFSASRSILKQHNIYQNDSLTASHRSGLGQAMIPTSNRSRASKSLIKTPNKNKEMNNSTVYEQNKLHGSKTPMLTSKYRSGADQKPPILTNFKSNYNRSQNKNFAGKNQGSNEDLMHDDIEVGKVFSLPQNSRKVSKKRRKIQTNSQQISKLNGAPSINSSSQVSPMKDGETGFVDLQVTPGRIYQEELEPISSHVTVERLDLQKLGSTQNQNLNNQSFNNDSNMTGQSSMLRAQEVIQSLQAQQMLVATNEKKDENIMNPEQRQVMNQMIEKLDIQDTIRHKARVFFNKEQLRLQSESKSKHRGKPHTRPAGSSIGLRSGNNSDKEQELQDQDLLDNTYNERHIASQHEVKRSERKLVTSQDTERPHQVIGEMNSGRRNNLYRNSQHTQERSNQMQFKDGQIFDKNQDSGTLNTSAGASLAHPNDNEREQLQEAFNQQAFSNSQAKWNIDQKSSVKEESYKRKSNAKSISQLQSNSGSMPSLSGTQQNRKRKQSKLSSQNQMSELNLNLQQLAKEYSQAQQQKMSQTTYNTRPTRAPDRLRLDPKKKDYCPLILGQYRFGLNQKPPKSMDPNASELMRFSQMCCHRFAKKNEPFMQLYEDKIIELRKTRRFLNKQINKSPEGKKQAQIIQAESPLMNKMSKKIQLQLIEEALDEDKATKRTQQAYQNNQQQQLLEPKKKLTGLKEIQRHNKEMTQKRQLRNEVNSQMASCSSGSSIHRMGVMKSKMLDKLIKDESLASLNSGQQNRLNQSINHPNIAQVEDGGLDIHEDFMSDASEETKIKMKKATYEMDQLVTDDLFKEDQYAMGLSMYFMQQEVEQKHNFRAQQKQLMNYLNILFGGDMQQQDCIQMAQNLTKKLKRQGTDDSHAKRRADEIHHEKTAGLNFDEDNINIEIVGLLAEEILRKTEFFDLFKGNVRGQKGAVQQSQLNRLQSKQDNGGTFESFASNKEQLFSKVKSAMESSRGFPPKSPQLTSQQTQELQMQRLPSKVLDEHLQKEKDGFLNHVVHQANNEAHIDTELDEIEDVQKEMAKASFIQSCEKNMVVTLPLLLRINNKRLVLERYQLNHGLCQALSLAFTQFTDIVNEFYLENNNLTDDDFAVMLKGMGSLTIVNQLTYTHNTFGPASMAALQPIICNDQVKFSLRNLHLKHCKMSAKTTFDLLHALNSKKNAMRSLSLVNVNLNQSNYQELCAFIKSSKHLQNLDISWNGMRCHQMYEIIDAISDNRTLQDLNLSYNNLHDSMQEKFAESTPAEMIKSKALKDKQAMKIKYAKTEKQKVAAELDAMTNSMTHILKICKFIKMNSNLMHLNLSGMGMTAQMMNEFGRALRRTKSMVSLHLSQNNGDSAALRLALFERAHVKPFEEVFRPDFRQLKNLEYKNGPGQNNRGNFKLENSIMFGAREDEAKQTAAGKSKISEQLNLKNIIKNKRGSVARQNVENDPSEMLIFNRYLGHKTEMPGSGQWRMIATQNDTQERCWICNLEMYSLVFWSRDFGLKTHQEMKRMGIDEMAYENQLFEIEDRLQKMGIKVDFTKDKDNPQVLNEAHKSIGFPQIYGEFNNWKPDRMYTIEEFCYIMDKDKPDIIKNLKRGNFISQMVETAKDLNDEERVLYNERTKGLLSKYTRMKNWRKLLGQQLRFKKPYLANAEALLFGDEDVNIAKMDEELYPSDSQSDYNSDSESESDYEEDYGNQYESEEEYERFQQLAQKSSTTPHGSSSFATGNMRSFIKSKPRELMLKLKERNKINQQLYVMPVFLKPGKQTFVVQSQVHEADVMDIKSKEEKIAELAGESFGRNSALIHASAGGITQDLLANDDYSEQYFFHEVMIPHRREKVPVYAKMLARKENDEIKFDRNQTCFKDWNPPSEKDFEKMFNHDVQFWRLPRFIKDEKELNDVYQVFQQNMRGLFYIFVTLSANSSFPGITWLNFTKFNEQCKIMGGNVAAQDVDRFFLASAGEMAQQGCYRFQFFEAIMRVADLKYFKSGAAKTYSEAFKMFLTKNFFALGPLAEWQDWREKIWWTYENHQIITANTNALTKIYKSFFAPRKKYMNKADCIDLMTRKTKIIPDENRVIYCYGMSKMAVIMETVSKQPYEEMKYVEFLEFIGRCAFAKFKNEEDDIQEMLKLLMDELFPAYGLVRKEVEIEEDELSESDPDY